MRPLRIILALRSIGKVYRDYLGDMVNLDHLLANASPPHPNAITCDPRPAQGMEGSWPA